MPACLGQYLTSPHLVPPLPCSCSFLFFLAIVISWVMRDFARPLLEKIPCKQQSLQQQQQLYNIDGGLTQGACVSQPAGGHLPLLMCQAMSSCAVAS